MRLLGNHDYPEVVQVLKAHREEWGDQVRIGPPSADVDHRLIGVYLDDAAQKIADP